MAPGLLLIGDSQLKHAPKYAHLFPHYDISVIPVSGMRVEEVDESMLLATSFFNDVVIHLGTNNLICGNTPDETMIHLEVLIKKIKRMNPEINIYISSVLRRAQNGYRGFSDYHHRKISLINKEVEKVNRLFEELAKRYRATFINNWMKFTIKSTNPERDLLSRDGLHLTHLGVKTLLGNVIHSCDLRVARFSALTKQASENKACSTPLPTQPCNSDTSVSARTARSTPLPTRTCNSYAGVSARSARSTPLPTQPCNSDTSVSARTARSTPLPTRTCNSYAGVSARSARSTPLPTQPCNSDTSVSARTARSTPLPTRTCNSYAGVSARSARSTPLPTQPCNSDTSVSARTARSTPLPTQTCNSYAGVSARSARSTPLPTRTCNSYAGVSARSARSTPLPTQTCNSDTSVSARTARSTPLPTRTCNSYAGVSARSARSTPLPTRTCNSYAGVSARSARSTPLPTQPCNSYAGVSARSARSTPLPTRTCNSYAGVSARSARSTPLPTQPCNSDTSVSARTARSTPLPTQTCNSYAGVSARSARSTPLPTQPCNSDTSVSARTARFTPLPTQTCNSYAGVSARSARSTPLPTRTCNSYAGVSARSARSTPLPTQTCNSDTSVSARTARSTPLPTQTCNSYAGVSARSARSTPLPTQPCNSYAGVSARTACSTPLPTQPQWTLVSYSRKNFPGKIKSPKIALHSSNCNDITLSNRWLLLDHDCFQYNTSSAVITPPKKLLKRNNSNPSQKHSKTSIKSKSCANEVIPSIIPSPSSLCQTTTRHKYFHKLDICRNGGSSKSGISFSTYPRECEVCNKTYSCKSSFCRHKKNCSKDHKYVSSIVYPRICPKCNVSFSTRGNYSRHKRSCDTAWKYIVCPCPGCEVKFQCYTDLLKHLQEYHSEGVNVEEHDFKDMSEFQLWKSDVCRETNISMVKHSGSVVSHASGSVQYFVCKFNNNHKKDLISNKTSRKRKFGRMPNTDCIARMIVKEHPEDFSVNVKYFNSHNHDLGFKNVKYYSWDKFTKLNINALLEQGVPAHDIQESFQPVDLDINDEAPQKEHFISTTQINKMKYDLKMKKRLNKDDALAVHMFVHSMKEEENSILMYKPLDKLTEIGRKDLDNSPNASQLFALGIQNKQQLKEMVEGCTRILCIDSTHGTNHYKYHLLNFVVPDEYGVGYPVAHFIINVMDEETLVCLLRAVKDKCPNLVVNAVMTDGDEALGNAIRKVFGEDIRHLLCSWHVKRNWQKNLNRKLRGQDALINEVNEILETMIEEKNAHHFNAMLEAFLSHFSDSAEPFVSYFRENYASNTEKWAKCFRNFPHANTDTNMFVESFHNKLKTHYLNRKVNRRLDDLIAVLLRINKSIHLSLLYKRKMEVPPLGFGGSLKERHVRGLQIPDEDVVENNDTSWRVKSQANSAVTYTVTRYSENCFLSDSCFIKCCELSCDNLCCHQYCCSCPDRHSLCKHIHKVHSSKIRSAPSASKSPILHCSGEQIINSTSLINKKSKEDDVIQSIANLCDKVKMLSRNCKVRSLLQHINNSLKLAVEKCEGLIDSEHSEARPSAMEHEHTPPNTKLTSQYKLYKTVKERQNTKHRFKKPNLARQNEIKASLLSPLQEISFTSPITESEILTKTLIQIGPYSINQLHLKSLDYFVPEEEVNRLKAVAQDFHRGWLYDTVISAFLLKITNDNSLFTFVDPALSALALRMKPLERFMTFINKADVFSSPNLFIPFNVTNSHWVLSLALLENKEIHFYDPANSSLGNVNRPALDIWVQILSSHLQCDAEEWKIITPEHSFQDDGHNCGVYVCWYAERIVSGNCTTEKLNPYEYRKYIHDVIVGVKTPCNK